MSEQQEDLITLAHRGYSGCCDLNFLSRIGKVYFMDNHRAALWCWMRHLSATDRVTVVHIDRHTDCLSSNLDDWTAASVGLESLSLDSYLSMEHCESCLFRWDNFISLFIRHFGERIHSLYMATRDVGDQPERHSWDIEADLLPATLESLPSNLRGSQFIVDLDLDYFVARIAEGEHVRLYSDAFMHLVFRHISGLISHPQCACVTVALSPECCGGWQEAELLLSQFSQITGYALRLP
jgi:hypothetical protein